MQTWFPDTGFPAALSGGLTQTTKRLFSVPLLCMHGVDFPFIISEHTQTQKSGIRDIDYSFSIEMEKSLHQRPQLLSRTGEKKVPHPKNTGAFRSASPKFWLLLKASHFLKRWIKKKPKKANPLFVKRHPCTFNSSGPLARMAPITASNALMHSGCRSFAILLTSSPTDLRAIVPIMQKNPSFSCGKEHEKGEGYWKATGLMSWGQLLLVIQTGSLGLHMLWGFYQEVVWFVRKRLICMWKDVMCSDCGQRLEKGWKLLQEITGEEAPGC